MDPDMHALRKAVRQNTAIETARDHLIAVARQIAAQPGADIMLQSAVAALDHAEELNR